MQVSWIAAEDTRVSRVLLNHVGSGAPMVSLHEHNEAAVCASLVERLLQGQAGALISDAGTPAISDPGALLVAAAHAAGVRVIPVPGPSAPIALLSAAGFAPGPHFFAGFLPARPRARQQRLKVLHAGLDALAAHLILFEAPHRVAECVDDLLNEFGADRLVVLGRELTKQFEEVHRCQLQAARSWLDANPHRLRGEYAIAIAAPLPAAEITDHDEAGTAAARDLTNAMYTTNLPELLTRLMQELPLSQAVRIAERLTGSPHRILYQLALTLNKD